MQYIAAPSPRLPDSKTVVSRALSGTGNAVHFSLITITERSPKYLSRKHFGSYHRHEEGLLNNRGAGEGDAAPSASLCPLLSLPVPTGVICHSGLLPELPPAAKTALRSGHVLHTLCPYGCETLEDWGRFTPCLCHQKWSYTQSGQQQALWLQLG